MMQVLSLGVQNRDDTDLGAEVAWIGGDRAQRLGGRPEQDGIDRRLVLEGDLGHRGRHREHDVSLADQAAFVRHLGGLRRLEWVVSEALCRATSTDTSQGST
jgi:hypothetical protein